MAADFGIIWLDTVDSTNSEVQRRISSLDNLAVIAARCQTAGRGQRGNTWQSAPGENLTFSVLLKAEGMPPVTAAGHFFISEAATIAVHDYLTSEGIACRIKWPNDIYSGDKKICGMLIENGICGSKIATSIIGIGLNVNQTEFGPGLMNPTSMKKLTGRDFSVEEALVAVMERLTGLLPLLDSESGRKKIRERYLESLYRLGELHDYTDCRTGNVFRGRITGVSETSELIVEMPDGREERFAFKEIGYII